MLHTLPGGAQPIGVALDAEEWPEVMGTIAGDDTILIVCRSSCRQKRSSGGSNRRRPSTPVEPRRRALDAPRADRLNMQSQCIFILHRGAVMIRTIALAYSGGLDTSIIVPWLREHYDARVICVAADIGQGDELDGVRAKAIASGADECYVEDLRHEFVTDFIWPTLRAGAVYGRKYLLGTSMARPLIAKRQVEVARAVGADALAHGCTGKGNDQVRFELTYAAFAPDLPVIAPWREWDIRSREDAHRLRRRAQRAGRRDARQDLLARPQSLAPVPRRRRARAPAPAPPTDLFMLTTAPDRRADTPEDVVDRIRARHAGLRQRRTRSLRSRSSRRSTRSAASTASDASTSSRTGWSE